MLLLVDDNPSVFPQHSILQGIISILFHAHSLFPNTTIYLIYILLLVLTRYLFVTLFSQYSTNEPTIQHTMKQLKLLRFNYVLFSILFSHLLLIQGNQYPKPWVLSFLLFDVYLSTCVYIVYTREQPLVSLLSTIHCFCFFFLNLQILILLLYILCI